MSASTLGNLNAAQREAVVHGTNDRHAAALLIIAGAGSGKTSTLAHRVAHLVANGADPHRILLLTFSRRAAAELERRAASALASSACATFPPGSTLPWAGTFHSVAARLLRRFAVRIGLAENFTVHDRGDSEDLMGLARHELLADEAAKTRFPASATCVAIYSRAVNCESSLNDVLRTTFPWCAHLQERLQLMFARYVDAKQSQHCLDFDDLLLYWAGLMQVPELAREVAGLFDCILVDEYQDTNKLQATILRLLKPDGAGVTVVGDDAQAIYSFRAATVRNILDFPAQYSPPAKVITLAQNYRSNEPILKASNAVIALARERYTKDLTTDRLGGRRPCLVTIPDESAQALYVAEQVLVQREHGVALKQQAVLFRSSNHSAQLEIELGRRNIPFVKYGGLRFLDAAHVRDVLSILRWIDNPRGRLAGFRVLRLIPGVGPATATNWLDRLDNATDVLAAFNEFRAPAAGASAWHGLSGLCTRLQQRDSAWPAELDSVLDWYEPLLHDRHDDAPARLADLTQLRRIAGAYPSRERFLTELTLDPPAATSAESDAVSRDEDYLTLSTIHSAKGQEWKAVHILNCVDGCIPSDMATATADELEEERRLLYVAMTRAKEHLDLLIPQRFYVHRQSGLGDRHVYASRSRFLPDVVCVHFDVRTWPEAQPGTAARAQAKQVDLALTMRQRWAPGNLG